MPTLLQLGTRSSSSTTRRVGRLAMFAAVAASSLVPASASANWTENSLLVQWPGVVVGLGNDLVIQTNSCTGPAGTPILAGLRGDIGTTRWHRDVGDGTWDLACHGGPVVDSAGNVYVGGVKPDSTGSGTQYALVSLSPNGSTRWAASLPGPIYDSRDGHGGVPPIAFGADGRVWLIAHDPNPSGPSYLKSFSTGDGKPGPAADLDSSAIGLGTSPSGVSVDGRTLYNYGAKAVEGSANVPNPVALAAASSMLSVDYSQTQPTSTVTVTKFSPRGVTWTTKLAGTPVVAGCPYNYGIVTDFAQTEVRALPNGNVALLEKGCGPQGTDQPIVLSEVDRNGRVWSRPIGEQGLSEPMVHLGVARDGEIVAGISGVTACPGDDTHVCSLVEVKFVSGDTGMPTRPRTVISEIDLSRAGRTAEVFVHYLGIGSDFVFADYGDGTGRQLSGVREPGLGGAFEATFLPGHRSDSRYVALGDSYSAGEGLGPPYEHTAPGCHRSALGYPTLVDRHFRYRTFADRACTRAVTDDFFHAEPGRQDAQLNLLGAAAGADTKLVTLTVGGNDVGLRSILEDCVALGFFDAHGKLPGGFPGCALKDGAAVDKRLAALRGLGHAWTPEGRLVHALEDVLIGVVRKAPNATVVIGTYPQLFPGIDVFNALSSKCRVGSLKVTAGTLKGTAHLAISRSDAVWSNSVADRLNAAIREAAGRVRSPGTGRIVVADAARAFRGRHAVSCGGDRPSHWINQISGELRFHSVKTLVLDIHPADKSFHPKAAGQEAYARAFEGATR